MALISEPVETDTRERILVVAERLFRQIGYQKTTVADIAKELRMSPANVYRFFDSKKSIHEGVARTLMGEVEIEARRIAAGSGPAKPRLRELLTTINRMNTERYVGDSKLHEMVEIAMDRDRRHRVVARELGQRCAADGLDVLKDPGAARSGRERAVIRRLGHRTPDYRGTASPVSASNRVAIPVIWCSLLIAIAHQIVHVAPGHTCEQQAMHHPHVLAIELGKRAAVTATGRRHEVCWCGLRRRAAAGRRSRSGRASEWR